SWNPQVSDTDTSGVDVFALAYSTSNAEVYAGGTFTTVGISTARDGVAAFGAVSGGGSTRVSTRP
ncbi:MAG TPA: hypothetical protein VGL76_07125, partial [Gaiellaceae bacterium]